MKKNLGKTDRIVRLVLALILVILLVANVISGTLGWILGILAVIFLVTSAVSFCPLYYVLGMSTCETK